MKRSEVNKDLVFSSNIIMLSQWSTWGVIINLKVLLPVFKVSFSQKEMWSTGTLFQPERFNFEVKSLHNSLVLGDLRKSIPPHSSLSKCKNATCISFSRGITSFTFSAIFSYIPIGPV